MPDSLQLHRLQLPGSSVHGDSPGKNTGMGCHALLQGIFLTQGLNQGLPHCRWVLSHLSHQESPMVSIGLSTLLMFSNYHKFIRSSFLSLSLIAPFISSISFLVFSFGLHWGIYELLSLQFFYSFTFMIKMLQILFYYFTIITDLDIYHCLNVFIFQKTQFF